MAAGSGGAGRSVGGLPVVMMADLMAAGLHSGWSVRRRPTMPETCGHDMDVPDSELKATRRRSKARSVGELARVHAAITLTPGAVMSGCNTQIKPLLIAS